MLSRVGPQALRVGDGAFTILRRSLRSTCIGISHRGHIMVRRVPEALSECRKVSLTIRRSSHDDGTCNLNKHQRTGRTSPSLPTPRPRERMLRSRLVGSIQTREQHTDAGGQKAGDVNPEQAARVLKSIARLNHGADGALVRAVLDGVTARGVETHTPQDMVLLLSACTSVGHRPPTTLLRDAVSHIQLTGIERMTSEEIAEVVRALAACDYSPDDTFTREVQVAVSASGDRDIAESGKRPSLDKVEEEALNKYLAAFTKLSIFVGDAFLGDLTRLVRWQGLAARHSPKELMEQVTSFARRGGVCGEDAALEDLIEAVRVKGIDAFSPMEVTMVCATLYAVGHNPGDAFFDHVLATVRSRGLDKFTSQELQILLQTLGKFNARATRAFQKDYTSHVKPTKG